jgi:hypothetical protein
VKNLAPTCCMCYPRECAVLLCKERRCIWTAERPATALANCEKVGVDERWVRAKPRDPVPTGLADAQNVIVGVSDNRSAGTAGINPKRPLQNLAYGKIPAAAVTSV